MQNNLVMKIKKVAALAGSAIMASSMMAPVMAATLANLPAPFVTNGVFNANIVVGSSGTAAGISSDLAGAMDVAAAFAQQASATVTSSGSISLTRPMTPGQINSSTGYMNITNSPVGTIFNNSVSGFDWMTNATVSYNDTEYPIYEKLTVGATASINYGGEYAESPGNVVYTVSYNGTAKYEFPVGSVIPMFGQNYQIVSIPAANEVKFGNMVDNKGLTFPSTVTIPGEATIQLLDFSTTGNQDVLVKVTAENGTVMFNDFMSNVGTKDNLGDYLFTLSNLRTLSSGASTIDLSWSTSAFSLQSTKNASALDASLANWKVNIVSDANGDGNLSSISFTSPSYPNNIKLVAGESLGVMDYFNLTFAGWRDVNTTSISITNIPAASSGGGVAPAISYTNNESESKALYLHGITGTTIGTDRHTSTLQLIGSDDLNIIQLVNYTHMWVKNAGGDALQLVPVSNFTQMDVPAALAPVWSGAALFNTSSAWYNITFVNTSGSTYPTMQYNITLLNFTAKQSPKFGGELTNYTPLYLNEISYAATSGVDELNNNGKISGTLTVKENNGDVMTIVYKNNTIDSLTVAGKGNLITGEDTYTAWGGMVSRTVDSINIEATETRRQADLWIGRSATEATTVSVGDEIDGEGWTVAGSNVASAGGVTPITPGIGASASAYSSPVTLAKPTIIIGGGDANLLTAELAANEEGITTAALLEATNKAYLELIENAFGGSQTVLVIAGRDAKDTKLACQALAAHVAGTRAMDLSGNLVWLDTSSSSYTTVSVVADAE
ncbi:MAG: hypothetical protein WC393_03225 [Candidatus Nanoarchaeia archaeon]